MRECDNSIIHISSNFLLSIYIYIYIYIYICVCVYLFMTPGLGHREHTTFELQSPTGKYCTF